MLDILPTLREPRHHIFGSKSNPCPAVNRCVPDVPLALDAMERPGFLPKLTLAPIPVVNTLVCLNNVL